jgi:uncharacterized protein with HEPN domain
MSVERKWAFRIEHIADERTVDAVIRNFQIIGEAARQCPEIFKTGITTSPGH